MMLGNQRPELHSLMHRAADWLGFHYGDGTPVWVHVIMHLILVYGPVFLTLTIIVIIARRIFLHSGFRLSQPPARTRPSAVDFHRSLFFHVLHSTLTQQICLLSLSLSLMPLLYLSLELPKQIVNNVLEQPDAELKLIGIDLSAVQLLTVLSSVYLATITLNGIGKYNLNVRKGRLAERFLRRLRLRIYKGWRGHLTTNRKAEISQVLNQEVEPLGGFAADVISLPVTQGGTLLTILLFMFVQDPILGAAAVTVLPLQLILLPYLQRIVNRLSRKRIQEMRTLTRSLAAQIRVKHNESRAVLETAASLRRLERLRQRIHRIKFLAKALNNFLTALTPFLFYSLGGYFVIQERITLGALIAVLAAHKDFSAPLKELFRYYQQLEDTRIRYNEVLGFVKGDETEAVKT
jgi:ABC-type bacteriocin/lantibiotic exporter with double-glycine peptidase domain